MKTSESGFYTRVAVGTFTKMNADALVPFARNVIALMTGNPAYATPAPPLAAVTAQTSALEAAALAARDGGKILIATRNAEQEKLLVLLRQLAAFVQANCDNDLPTLLSSGFSAVRTPSPVGVLPAPQNPRLELTGMSGQLLFRCDRLVNSLNLTLQTATNPQGPWTVQDLSTTTRILIEELTPGTVYWARACGNGSAGGAIRPRRWRCRAESLRGLIGSVLVRDIAQRAFSCRRAWKLSEGSPQMTQIYTDGRFWE